MTTKAKMVVIFNLQNFHLLTLSLPIDEGLQVNGQDRPEANLPVVDFHSQPKEMLTPKPGALLLLSFTVHNATSVYGIQFPSVHGRQHPSTSASPQYLIHYFQQS